MNIDQQLDRIKRWIESSYEVTSEGLSIWVEVRRDDLLDLVQEYERLKMSEEDKGKTDVCNNGEMSDL